MWSSFFDDVSFAKDFFRKAGEGKPIQFALLDPLSF